MFRLNVLHGVLYRNGKRRPYSIEHDGNGPGSIMVPDTATPGQVGRALAEGLKRATQHERRRKAA